MVDVLPTAAGLDTPGLLPDPVQAEAAVAAPGSVPEVRLVGFTRDFLNMCSKLVHYCNAPVLWGTATVDPGRHDARGRDGADKVRITSVDRRGIRPVRPALAEDPYAAAQVVVEQLGRDGDELGELLNI